MDAEDIIRLLDLEPHPEEGGWFREVYRAAGAVPAAALAGGYDGPRAHSTAIYYLLTPETFSALHRVASDEVFHFYLGDPVEQLRLMPGGASEMVTLGPDLEAGQQPLSVVPAGVWQGARLAAGGRWALMGATVAPGFEYADYTHGDRAALTEGWPDRAELIAALST